MDNEAGERIKYLNQGPWIKAGALAWQTIASPVGGPVGEPTNSETQMKLKRLLRPHWVEDIVYSEGIVRDSFDEALTIYQLYELAIENSYLDLADIKAKVTTELTRLLWSDGARSYLHFYGYMSIIALAQRVGIDLGFKKVVLPPIRNGKEGRFASFLSQHALWYEDPILDGWIGFLDDYQVLKGEIESDKSVFRKFLGSEQGVFDNDAILWTFVAGADRFTTRVADLAELLSEEERPSYGLFYAYWMARFYGFTLTDNSYVRDPKRIDWSSALSNSKRIIYFNEKRKGSESDKADGFAAFKRHDLTVRKFWQDTLKHLGTATQANISHGAAS